MKKSDIILIAAVYAITAFFFVLVLQYPSDVRIYPIFIMVVLAVLTTMHLIECLVKFAREKKIENDMPLLFEHFKAKQFFAVFAMLSTYVVLINILGFYISSLLFIAGTLIFFKIKPLYIVITTAVFLVLIYGGFSTFLHVPLPRGLLI